jgi:hypothetical protein
MVPCDPSIFLDSDYGPNKWKIPLEDGYVWVNFESDGKWTNAEWPHAIKFYNRKGFDKQGTLEYLKEYASRNVAIVDVDDKDDEF